MDRSAGGDGPDAGQPGGSQPSETARPRRWLILAAFAGAAGLALGLLGVFGEGTGPVPELLTLLILVAGFVLALVKTLGEELKQASRRSRVLYVTSASVCALALVAAGLLTQSDPALTRLTGSADVAIVGILAPTPTEQRGYDDVAASLEEALPDPVDGVIRDYTGEVTPPLEQLKSPTGGQQELDRWLGRFFADTDAELVIAGFSDDLPGVQAVVHIAVYVPARTSADAAELSGWFVLTDYLLDRGLDSARARAALFERVSAQFGGLTAFLEGLDAWQNGNAAEAVTAFARIVRAGADGTPDTLLHLALLFRGHAFETMSQVAGTADRSRLLELARLDYRAVPASSPIATRARLSQATNDYLRAATAGCVANAPLMAQLARASATLADIEQTAESEMIGLKARVNRAQIEYCRHRAGDPAAGQHLRGLLAPLTSLSIAEDDIQADGKYQVKALALSIAAILLRDANRLDQAVDTLSQAIALDPRLERQSLWLGLQSGWLLASCRIEEAITAQQASLAKLKEAVQRSRIPSSEIDVYAAVFASDRDAARRRCGAKNPTPR